MHSPHRGTSLDLGPHRDYFEQLVENVDALGTGYPTRAAIERAAHGDTEFGASAAVRTFVSLNSGETVVHFHRKIRELARFAEEIGLTGLHDALYSITDTIVHAPPPQTGAGSQAPSSPFSNTPGGDRVFDLFREGLRLEKASMIQGALEHFGRIENGVVRDRSPGFLSPVTGPDARAAFEEAIGDDLRAASAFFRSVRTHASDVMATRRSAHPMEGDPRIVGPIELGQTLDIERASLAAHSDEVRRALESCRRSETTILATPSSVVFDVAMDRAGERFRDLVSRNIDSIADLLRLRGADLGALSMTSTVRPSADGFYNAVDLLMRNLAPGVEDAGGIVRGFAPKRLLRSKVEEAVLAEVYRRTEQSDELSRIARDAHRAD